MKALTLMQPSAWLVAAGLKTVENRTRQTHYRGPLLIHAGKNTRYYTGDADWFRRMYGVEVPPLEKAVLGAIIGRVELVDCVSQPKLLEPADLRWASRGPWYWVLRDAVAFEEPIVAQGKQGLWNYDEGGNR